jgi:hypothetical protein
MKHSFLITAYRDAPMLEALIEQLLALPDAYLWINIDGRYPRVIAAIKPYLERLNSPRVQLRTRRVRWGSYEHMDVFLQMAQAAMQDGCEYFHTITGQCRIVRPLNQFEEFFEKEKGKSFIQYFALPDVNWNGIGEPRLDRVKYYQLHDLLDARRLGIVFEVLNRSFKGVQKLLGINRLKERTYYGGIVYFSLHRNAMAYLLTEWENISSEFKYTFCCEETVPQTILLNGPQELVNSLVNFDLRYILWATQHGENPGLLDLSNLEAVLGGEHLFARKFDSRYAIPLIESIQANQSEL